MNFIKQIIRAYKAYHFHRKWSPRFIKYCAFCKHSVHHKCRLIWNADCQSLNPYHDCQYYKGADNDMDSM